MFTSGSQIIKIERDTVVNRLNIKHTKLTHVYSMVKEELPTGLT